MIVADASALVSLATGETLDVVLAEFDVATTETVLDELAATAEFDDASGNAARSVLDRPDHLGVHGVTSPGIESNRIDAGEGSCLALCRELDAAFLVTDDVRALPELQVLADARVAISPIVLRALVDRGCLSPDEALDPLDRIADRRSWLGAPIYRRARSLFRD